jgi:hypothetical protein
MFSLRTISHNLIVSKQFVNLALVSDTIILLELPCSPLFPEAAHCRFVSVATIHSRGHNKRTFRL